MKLSRIFIIFIITCGVTTVTYIYHICFNYYSYAKDNTSVYNKDRLSDDTLRIVMIGDSWVAYHHAAGHDSALAELLGRCTNRPTIIRASGMVGAKTKTIYKLMYDSISSAATRNILKKSPDYCIISSGINDAVAKMGTKNYSYHYMLILKQLLVNHIKPIIIDMPDVGYQSVYQRESFFTQFRHRLSCMFNGTDMWSFNDYRNSLIKNIQDSNYTHRVIYINAKEWNPQGHKDSRNLYMPDDIHLNANGYTLLDSCIATHICMDIESSKHDSQ